MAHEVAVTGVLHVFGDFTIFVFHNSTTFMDNATISKATFRGTLACMALLVLLFVLPDILAQLSGGISLHLSAKDHAFREAAATVQRKGRYRYERRPRQSRYHAPPAAFDPNTYTLEEWMALGLSEKQAAVVLKFTKYGMRSNADLQKVFVISEELFALIKDSTRYAPRSYDRSFQSDAPAIAEEKVLKRVALNTASVEELLEVKGIGPFFAKQILKRRDELGGFYTATQLLEVWKMDDEHLQPLLPALLIDPSAVKRININTATAEELKAHPYISWNLANSIVKLRSQNGSYRRVEDIQKSVLVTGELFEKLKHYITVDE